MSEPPKLPLAKSETQMDTYFRELTKLQEDDVICRPNCKFCVHPARQEAEMKWEKTGIYASVERFFENYRKEHPEAPQMSFVNIKNHLLNHYEQQQKKVWLREYSDRLLAVMNKRVSDEQNMEIMKQQFQMKLHEITSDPTLDPFKQVDAMTKLGKIILEIQITAAKLRGEVQSVQLVTEKLTNVWVSLISDANDPRLKKLLMDSLNQFEDHLEGVPLLEDEN
jgi:hypothetical protein